MSFGSPTNPVLLLSSLPSSQFEGLISNTLYISVRSRTPLIITTSVETELLIVYLLRAIYKLSNVAFKLRTTIIVGRR